jgi:hypothetical protein
MASDRLPPARRTDPARTERDLRDCGSGDREPARVAIAARVAIICSVGLLAVGCSIVRPEARATDVRVVNSANGATQLAITVALTNPGKDEVELVEYDYALTLPDGSGYGGKWAALRALPPGATVNAEIPAVVPTASVASGVSAWRVSGSIEFRDPKSFARILYEAGLLRTSASFSGEGDALRPAAAAATPPASPAGGAR